MKIKVAVIGCGAISEFRHGPEYMMNENVEIVAFCDPVYERAERLAKLFGGKAYTDYSEVLKLEQLDAVSVCTSNNTHAKITVEALKAGKHVLCEKPMSTSLVDAQLMIETARDCGRFLMIGHNQRLVEAHKRAMQILKSGELGNILSFKTTFSHGGPESWSADKGKNTWFFRKDAAFLGSMGDLGIHKADLVRWLLEDEIDEVYAMTATRDKRDSSGELIGVEDNALCVLKSRTGIVGSLCASWTNYGEEDNSTILYCSNGVLRICDDPEYQLIIEGRNKEKQYFKVGEIQTNSCQTKSGVIDAFIASIASDIKPEICGEEGFEALSIVLACLEASEKGIPVKVKHADN